MGYSQHKVNLLNDLALSYAKLENQVIQAQIAQEESIGKILSITGFTTLELDKTAKRPKIVIKLKFVRYTCGKVKF